MALVPFASTSNSNPSSSSTIVEFISSGGDAPASSVASMVGEQRELFHAQVEQLQRLVVAHCRLTGVNPLAQEMAAGALSINIGKKPRDLLNPKAVNYMQSIFAVKDNIGKRETREISALCGVTVTQVRDFFASQRSRVRRLVRFSQEKANRIEESKAADNLCSVSSDEQFLDVLDEPPISMAEPLKPGEPVEVPGNYAIVIAPTDSMPPMYPVDPKTAQNNVQHETVQVEAVPGVESEDKKFLDSIFALMKKEETFSGQVKLMEWILQINNVALLSWFLTMGGLTILATWLSEAASEEQTSVLLVIFKVLSHLPLHKALPTHMSAILQIINRLRFYRLSDISNRARHLLSKLSKVLVRSQAMKRPHGAKDSQKGIICKQRISEILRDEYWSSEVDIPEEILALTESTSDSSRKPEPRKALTLLPASCDEPSKKNCPPKNKERRKVLLVEQPNRKTDGKSIKVARAVSVNNSRPMSADDIQKAKMRAVFMRDKYGKTAKASDNDKPPKLENDKTSAVPKQCNVPALRDPKLLNFEISNDPSSPAFTPSTLPQSPIGLQPSQTSQEFLSEKVNLKQISWQMPPEVWIDPSWSVGTGQNSKELEVQTQRNRRDKDIFYTSPQDIPPNPKDPWDTEIDFDDSLTPEIPIDQPPEADAMQQDTNGPTVLAGVVVDDRQAANSNSIPPPVISNGATSVAAEPDLELLAVLLKNPELVFALTSSQGTSLPSEQTVALLDVLKKSGLGFSELVNALANASAQTPRVPEPELETLPTSLPSPTPPSNPAARASWRSEFPTPARVPTLQTQRTASRGVSPTPNAVPLNFSGAITSSPAAGTVVTPVPAHPYVPMSILPAQMHTGVFSLPQSTVTINPTSQPYHPSVNSIPTRSITQQNFNHPSVNSIQTRSIMQQNFNGLESGNSAISNNTVVSSFTSAASQQQQQQQYSSFPEQREFASNVVPYWQSNATSVGAAARRDTTPDPWASRPNYSSDVLQFNPQLLPTRNTYNSYNSSSLVYNSGSVPASNIYSGQALDGVEFVNNRSQYGMYAQDGRVPPKAPEFRADWNYGGQRVDGSNSNYSHEHSREWNSGYRDHDGHGSGHSWRSREHDHDRR